MTDLTKDDQKWIKCIDEIIMGNWNWLMIYAIPQCIMGLALLLILIINGIGYVSFRMIIAIIDYINPDFIIDHPSHVNTTKDGEMDYVRMGMPIVQILIVIILLLSRSIYYNCIRHKLIDSDDKLDAC